MEDEKILLKCNTHLATFNHGISSLRYKGSYTDVTLACNGKFYLLHKLVLVTCSEYFREILGSIDSPNPMLILTDIQCSDIESLLDYMYTGEVNVRQGKISSLLKAADFLRIKGLVLHQKESEILNDPSMLEKQTYHLKERNPNENSSTDLSSSISHTLTMQTPKSSIKHFEEPLVQNNSLANVKEARDIATLDKVQNISGTELNSSADFSDVLQTIEDDPLPMSDNDDCDLAGVTGKDTAAIPSCFSDKVKITEIVSGAVAEKQSPPLKRKRTDVNTTTGLSIISTSSRSCTLEQDPRSSIYYIVRNPLNIDNSCKSNYSIPCNQNNCNEYFRTLENFRDHLTNIHGEDHPRIMLSFKTREELEKWRKEFEDENVVKFRKKSSKGKVSYYYCNRSSCFMTKSKSTGKRKAKKELANGPSQISSVCTAGLVVIEKDKSFEVTLYPTHSNHPLDNKHKKCLRLPESLTNEYIKQIEMGVPLYVILNGISDEVKEQYGVSYKKLSYLKKTKVNAKTAIPADKILPDQNAVIESDSS